MSESLLVSRVATAAALLVASVAAQANDWAFTYSGPGINAIGTFTTAGSAASFEEILSITGTRNGAAITGLVPLATDPSFVYDNLFKYSGGIGTLSSNGSLFNVAGVGHINIGNFESQPYELYYSGPPIPANFHSANITFSATPVAAVPEPETYALLLVGFAAIGLARRRRSP